MIDQLRIALQIQDSRDVLERLHGREKFIAEAETWKRVFRIVQRQQSCDVLNALIILLRRAIDLRDARAASLWLCATAAELISPRPETTTTTNETIEPQTATTRP